MAGRKKGAGKYAPLLYAGGAVLGLVALLVVVRWLAEHWQLAFAGLAVVAVGVMLFLLRTSPSRRRRSMVNAALDEFDDLDPPIFVSEIACRLPRAGFTDVEIVTDDQIDRDVPDIVGIDRLGRRVLVRCEQYVVENIGPKVVKALDRDAADVYDADVAVLVTNREVLSSAAVLVEDLEMVAIDREALGEWLVSGVMPYDVSLPAFPEELDHRPVSLDADPYAPAYAEDEVIDLRKPTRQFPPEQPPRARGQVAVTNREIAINRRRTMGDRKRSPYTA
ncbi:restriction endonuclease [Fodinicola acaciae]|uniref:restriction endonuclease n=1 Tax=Fodinicola acaciae TaxID=2681555 RepID=UPI0013D4F101|nr:restriction endonuclease [Fodinicola acaciae]